jgi:hypothetical protein
MQSLLHRGRAGVRKASTEAVLTSPPSRPEKYTLQANDQYHSRVCWTPDKVLIMPTKIKLVVTGKNIEQTVQLAEEWTMEGIPVVLHFPSHFGMPRVGSEQDPLPFGMSAEECFERVGKVFMATRKFIEEVAGLFSDSPLVIVDPRFTNFAD